MLFPIRLKLSGERDDRYCQTRAFLLNDTFPHSRRLFTIPHSKFFMTTSSDNNEHDRHVRVPMAHRGFDEIVRHRITHHVAKYVLNLASKGIHTYKNL